MKFLVLDLETGPNLAHVWGLYKQNISLVQLLEESRVLCFAAKWVGTEEVMFFSEYHDGRSVMVHKAWELLNEADAVISYNGIAFDLPHLKREFLELGLEPPSPWVDIDLLKVVRKEFRFVSNKLQHITTKLGLDGKMPHSGHELWIKVLQGDDEAWDIFMQYNAQDVVLTEELYLLLRPWIKNHPNNGLLTGVERTCNRCGSPDLVKRGFYLAKTSRYQRYRCRTCGAWSRDTSRDARTTVTGI